MGQLTQLLHWMGSPRASLETSTDTHRFRKSSLCCNCGTTINPITLEWHILAQNCANASRDKLFCLGTSQLATSISFTASLIFTGTSTDTHGVHKKHPLWQLRNSYQPHHAGMAHFSWSYTNSSFEMPFHLRKTQLHQLVSQPASPETPSTDIHWVLAGRPPCWHC